MKEITKMKQLHEFDTLAKAQSFEYIVDTLKLTEGDVKQYLLQPGNVVDDTYPNKWAHMRALRGDLINPVSSIVDIMMSRLETNGYFDVDPDKSVGVGNILLANSLLNVIFTSTDDVNNFLNQSLDVSKPHLYATQEEFDKARQASVPVVEQEVTYPSETYIIKAPNQGFELDFVVTDGSTNNVWDIRLETCEVDQGQAEAANWFDVGQVFTPARQGKLPNTKYVIESTSKRTKTYNRFYVTPRKHCEFTVSVKAV